MTDPLITIVTPSLNQGRFLRDTIDSVMMQDYPHVELLIQDGGSTDESEEIARSYGDRVTFISERDRGQSDAINRGFRRARGELVSWLNSDDTLLPGALRRVADAANEHPGAGAIYGGVHAVDESGRLILEWATPTRFPRWFTTNVMFILAQPSIFFRRALIETLGGVNESLTWGMDWDLVIRASRRAEFIHIPEYLATARFHETMKTATGGWTRFREMVQILRHHSGRRYPPGVLVHAIELVALRLRKIGRRTFSSVRPLWIDAEPDLLGRWQMSLVRRVHMRALGWHDDGWALRRVRELVLPADGELVIAGVLPDWAPLQSQILHIRIDRRHVATENVAPGAFVLRYPMRSRPSGEPVEIEIKAEKTFSPRKRGLSADRRKLAYVLQVLAIHA